MPAESGAVRAQVEAVDRVARAVRSFAEQERELIAEARKQLKHKAGSAQAEVCERRHALEQAREATARAEMALARCREDCGGLAQAVAAARRRQTAAEQSLGRARQAAQMIEQAAAALNAVTRSTERTVGDHALAAITACRELADRLRGYLGHALGVADLTLSIVQGASNAGLALPNTPLAPTQDQTNVVEMVDDSTREQQDLWRSYKQLQLEDESGDWVGREE
jgi:ABC-type transporter Mla subunit MlaD